MNSRIKTQRNNKPSPIKPLFQNHHHQELLSPSSLGSNSGTIPFSSPITTTHYYYQSTSSSSSRPRAKSVGKIKDQKQLAREESFLKLCGQLTPPPLPTTPTPPTPRSRIKKYPSAHDLKKTLHHQKYNIELHHHIPLPQSPISPNREDDDSDDDIPLAMKQYKIRNQHPFLLNNQKINDDDDDDDTDLIPIGKLKPKHNESLKSAADKYKEKVKEYLQIDPISSSFK